MEEHTEEPNHLKKKTMWEEKLRCCGAKVAYLEQAEQRAHAHGDQRIGRRVRGLEHLREKIQDDLALPFLIVEGKHLRGLELAEFAVTLGSENQS